jgi:hypothetical protein
MQTDYVALNAQMADCDKKALHLLCRQPDESMA